MHSADGGSVIRNENSGNADNAVQAQSIDGGVHFYGASEGLVRELVKPLGDALCVTSQALRQNDRYIAHLESQVRDGLNRELALRGENDHLKSANDTILALFAFIAESRKALFVLRWDEVKVGWIAIAVQLAWEKQVRHGDENNRYIHVQSTRLYTGKNWGMFETSVTQTIRAYRSYSPTFLHPREPITGEPASRVIVGDKCWTTCINGTWVNYDPRVWGYGNMNKLLCEMVNKFTAHLDAEFAQSLSSSSLLIREDSFRVDTLRQIKS